MPQNADHMKLGSRVLRSGEITAVSPKFAEGYARIREVCDTDGACDAWAKALYMACAAAVKGHAELTRHELARGRELGLILSDARGAALTVLISRGEAVYSTFTAATDEVFGETVGEPVGEVPDFPVDEQAAREYFGSVFDSVPGYIELMADEAARALEGYVLMRQWSLGENTLATEHSELLLCTINAAEFSSRFVNVHANGARRAGCSEAQIVEAVLCAVPVAGLATWLTGADGIMESRT
jgi:alkylhydroperoxidase/carboxymuconolactone decarboxylase family protein YurZ